MRSKIIFAVIAVIAIAIAAYAVTRTQKVRIQREYIKVPEIRTVTKIKRVQVPVKEIEVIEKEKIIEVIKEIPQTIKDDPNKQITATAEIAPYEGQTDVVAVIDTASGKSEILAHQRPLPFFGFENKKELGIRYGVSTSGQVADIFGRWSFLRLGRAHIAAYAEATTRKDSRQTGMTYKPEAKAMAEVSYRW